jgi:hypothetical protein
MEASWTLPIIQSSIGASWVPAELSLTGMAIRVVEFSRGGYKIRKIFA